MSHISYKQTANQDSDFKIHYFSVESEIDFLTTANNCFEIIISPKGDNIGLYENTNGISTIANSIVGPGNSYSKLYLRKNVSGFHIRLSPNQVRSITEIPLHELAKYPSDLDCIFGRSYSNLLTAISDNQSIAHQTRLIESFFKLFIDRSKVCNKPGFLDIPFHDKQLLTVSALQSISGMSERSLERYFQDNIGITPRDYLGIERFNKFAFTLSHKRSGLKEISLLQLALDAGYYDQSHFIRQCKRYSGLTPNKFFKEYNAVLSGTYNY